MGVLDLDLTLLAHKPGAITDDSIEEQVIKIKTWEKSNRLGLMLIRMTIANNIKTSLPQTEDATKILASIHDCFNTLMVELTIMKYDGSKGVQQHIFDMTEKAAKLNSLRIHVSHSFLVQFILNSLLSQFGLFKIHYNTNKDN